MAMLEVRDLEVYYGVIQALKGISFDVNQGEIVALIGANGAGKTTTLHTVTGLLSARSGHIMYEGTDITKIPGRNGCDAQYDLSAFPAFKGACEPAGRYSLRR